MILQPFTSVSALVIYLDKHEVAFNCLPNSVIVTEALLEQLREELKRFPKLSPLGNLPTLVTYYGVRLVPA